MPAAELQLCYRIRRRSDGLFSTGGSPPGFTKKGKLWRTQGALTNHFNLVSGWQGKAQDVYANCDIVTYELTEQETEVRSAHEVLQAVADRKAAAIQKREKARRDRIENLERKKARDLIKKFGPNP